MVNTLFDIPEVSKARHSIRMMAGARNNRIKFDFYPTPDIATVSFLEREIFTGEIWEPACGNGAMSKIIERYKYLVKSSDLIYRGYGEGGVDFLRSSYLTNNIMTNPPFSHAAKFVHHALKHANKKVAMLLRLNFLESKARKLLFTDFPFYKLYVFSERVPFGVNPKSGSNAIAFGWFVWDYSYFGKPTIEWL
jgi:hypothetical protein